MEIRWLEPLIPIIKAQDLEGENTLEIYYPDHTNPERPHLFTPKNINHIILDIQLGLSKDEAAIRVGIKPSTLHSWYERNFGNIKTVIDKSKIDNKVLHLSRIVDAKDELKSKNAKWTLERKWREEYGNESKLSIKPEQIAEKQIFKIGDQEIEF